MKFFLVTLKEQDYDYFGAFVIVAKNKDEAIKHLKQKYIEELGGAKWSKGYKIKEIRPRDYKETIVILDSYNAG